MKLKQCFHQNPWFHLEVHVEKCRCDVCTNITERETGETVQINHEINCDGKCLIYLLTCKVCKKPYVGETTDAFRLRWGNYKDNDTRFQRNESCM